MLPREKWSDDRLDRFEKHVDERFNEVDTRFNEVDARFDRFEVEVNLRFKQVDHRFDRVEADIRELRAIMIGGFVTLLVALIGTTAL